MSDTREPWYREKMGNGEIGVRTSGGYLCFMPKPFHYPDQDQRYEEEMREYNANGHLIAAAPDLLEACKTALYGGGTIAEATEKCRAAIAKAEGRA